MSTNALKLKHHTLLKGLHYFQKRYPAALVPMMQQRGKSVVYKKRLPVSSNAPLSLVAEALEAENTRFTLYCTTLCGANAQALTEHEREKRARVWLEEEGLKQGDLDGHSGPEGWSREAVALLDSTFDELVNFEKESTRLKLEDPEVPPLLQVQKTAWRLLQQPPSRASGSVFLFSDAWDSYAAANEYRGADLRALSAWHKTASYWQKFLVHVGEQPVTQESVTYALSSYYRYLNKEGGVRGRSLTGSTVARMITPAKAALTHLVNEHTLPIVVKAPTVKGSTKNKERYTLAREEQVALVSLFSDESRRDYSAWKELFVRLSLHAGAHASELQRLKDSCLRLDGEVPCLVIEGEVKTKERVRVVPLVWEVNRIKQLSEELKRSSSQMVLGRKASGLSGSNISKQLGRMCKLIAPEATAYSLRHATAHNLDLVSCPAHIKAALLGWEGSSSSKVKPQQMRYGKTGRDTTERLLVLQEWNRQALAHFSAPGASKLLLY